MVGFCSCFTPSRTKYDSPSADAESHAACHVVQLMPEPAVQHVINNAEPALTHDTSDTQEGAQFKVSEYMPISDKLASHQITISPERPRAGSSDGSELAADVVRQDDIDTVKTLSPMKPVPAEEIQRASDFESGPAAPTADAASWANGDGHRSKSMRTPGSADKAAKVGNTPNTKAPWGSRAAAMQVTPAKLQTAKVAPHTPSSAPSPSITRPTRASSARAEAVSASKSAHSTSGTWKF